ncbi:uncharacterized protein [Arachis hypogaea]|uniref:uncharacterized protein n=1 Tax=Arachis hypogaea TaxID=3818 RepID=UPI000DED2219|nr:uncharacterized protein LOC112702996 [Arachis hypogaea]QHO28239.1 Putative nuclear matrix constituent protein 1-like protein [Arachis hypogaea]
MLLILFHLFVRHATHEQVEPATLVPLANQCKKVFLVMAPRVKGKGVKGHRSSCTTAAAAISTTSTSSGTSVVPDFQIGSLSQQPYLMIYDHQHHMGLLIIERRELASKYEQVKTLAESSELMHKQRELGN